MADRTTIAVAMSGGVDSSVAAALTVESGAEVIGVHLLLPRFGADGRPASTGPGQEDAGRADAARVCAQLGIELEVVDARDEFEKAVLDYFCQTYAGGCTPNPCVVCNERVKFGLLLAHAREAGAGVLATGHYARKVDLDGRAALAHGAGGCDQSYFLYRLSQDQLHSARFPVGRFEKGEVRRMAKEHSLSVHDKPDSQDLCFLPDGSYRRFLEERRPEAFAPGPIALNSGEVVGRHQGIASFTIGQRRGIGVAHSEPLYVVGFDRERNAVIVGERHLLKSRQVRVGDVNWVSVERPQEPLEATVRIRYNHPGARATVTVGDGETARVRFEEPQEAATPGQAAVFYRGDLLLGGGTILEAKAEEAAA